MLLKDSLRYNQIRKTTTIAINKSHQFLFPSFFYFLFFVFWQKGASYIKTIFQLDNGLREQIIKYWRWSQFVLYFWCLCLSHQNTIFFTTPTCYGLFLFVPWFQSLICRSLRQPNFYKVNIILKVGNIGIYYFITIIK